MRGLSNNEWRLDIVKEELLKGLNEEQIAKIKACKNQEEMLAVAKEEGVELTDEQLEAVSGGCGSDYCDNCGAYVTRGSYRENGEYKWIYCQCCGTLWAKVKIN